MSNKNFISMIEEYLNSDKTNYAFMISGDWGNGKTHFWKNEITSIIEEMDKKAIYISLNGVSNIDELYKKIYFESFLLTSSNLSINNLFTMKKNGPLAIKKSIKDKILRYVPEIYKQVANVTLLYNFGQTKYAVDFSKLIDLKDNIVLCFDDLERCRINIAEILGYINNFVEDDQSNTKVFIIGNEKEIIDHNFDINTELKYIASHLLTNKNDTVDDQTHLEKVRNNFNEIFKIKQYDAIKEKLIGKTILYQPDFDNVIKQLIEAFKYNEQRYFKFLGEQKQMIANILNTSERKNIRIIQHALDDFLKIFKCLDESELKHETHINSIKEKLFKVSIILSVSLREGNISNIKSNHKNDSKPPISIDIVLHYESSVVYNLHKTSELLKIYENYWDLLDSREFHSQAIAKHVLGNCLVKEELINDAQEINNIWFNNYKERTAIDILRNELFEVEDEVIKQAKEEVLNYIKEGSLPLERYSKIFNYFEELIDMQVIEENIEEIKDYFLKGIDNYKISDESADINMQLSLYRNRSQHTDEIIDLTSKKIKELNSHNLEEKVNSIVSYLPDFPDKFIYEYFELAKSNITDGILHFVDLESLIDGFRCMKNKDLNIIRNELNYIYDRLDLNHNNKLDKFALLTLKSKLEKEKNLLSNGPRRTLYKFLINDIDEWTNKISISSNDELYSSSVAR